MSTQSKNKETIPRKYSYTQRIGWIAVIGIVSYFIVSNVLPKENPFTVRVDDYVKWDTNAKVTLIEYLDFECEACRAYYPIVKEIANEFSGDLQVVARYFPLDGHKNSMTAARAVEAAARQGRFWEMHNILFETQSDWWEKSQSDQELFTAYAQTLGLNMEQYKKDIVSSETQKRINKNKKEAPWLWVNGTPSFFLNGQKIQNPKSLDEFRTLIRAEILKNPKISRGEKTHEHADYKVFINNKELSFSDNRYQSTTGKELNEAQHLHDNNGNNIHKHLTKNTIPNFFESLGILITADCIQLDNGEKYCSDTTNSLKFFVNNKARSKEDFMVYEFKDLDRILISYGSENKEEIQQQLNAVTDISCKYSDKCPERGKPPTENCAVWLGGDC